MPGQEDGVMTNLFEGARFWVSQHVPQQSKIKELIKQNGGVVNLIDRDVDMKIVDPSRKNLPPGCFGYRYVELSVQNGRLEDPDSHRAGPSDPRPMGATNIPRKGTRTDYTLREDQIAWDFLQELEKIPGAPTSGTKIFQKLAEKHPEHTWQSWRSRYVRVLRGKPRPGGAAPSSEATAAAETEQPPQVPAQPPVESRPAEGEASPRVAVEKPGDTKRKRDSSHGVVPSPTKRRAVEMTQTAIPAARDQHQARTPPSNTSRAQRENDPATRQNKTTPNPTRTKESFPKVDNGVDALFLEMPFLPTDPDMLDEDNDADGGGDDDDDDLDATGDNDAPDVNSWIDAQLAKGRSDEKSVIAALRCTSMDPELAEKLLEVWSAGQELPDMPDVWTADDDKALEGEDARSIERVLKKHGQEACTDRWKYLGLARERGLI